MRVGVGGLRFEVLKGFAYCYISYFWRAKRAEERETEEFGRACSEATQPKSVVKIIQQQRHGGLSSNEELEKIHRNIITAIS